MVKKTYLPIGALMVVAVLLARWIEDGEYYDPIRQRRHCAAPPSAIKDWSSTHHARRPGDSTNLDQWLQWNTGEVNRLFGAFCRSALHTAARFGREDLAELLIDRGADVRTPDEPAGDTALHLAAQYGHTAVATTLLARGADVNAVNRRGRTPLHDAVAGLAGTSDLEGRLAVAKLLISRGADIHARDRGSGWTPLDLAVAPSVNAANTRQMTELLMAAGADPRSGDSQGETALHRAASEGSAAAVARLLDGGADPNVAGRDTTALGAAAYQGHAEVVALLLARGADANESVPASRMAGNGAPLAMALLPTPGGPGDRRGMQQLEVARMLLDHGADIDARDREGRTVLHGVASRGELQAVELLLSRRASIDIPDAQGLTPLHLAIREGHVRVAAALLERGADVRVAARNGTTPLGLAARDREMEALVRRHEKR